MMADWTDCKRCSTRLERVELRGHLETWRCPACGWETWATVSFGDLPRVQGDHSVHLFLRWKTGTPSLSEVQQIRALLPSFQQRGVNDLRKEWGMLSEIDLGEFSVGDATRVLREAQGFGLLVRVSPPLEGQEPPG